MHHSRHCRTTLTVSLALFLVAAAGSLTAGQVAPPADPPLTIQAPAGSNYLVYTPLAKRPTLRNLLDDKTCAERKAEILKTIDKEALAKAKAFPCGYYALTCDPGRPANKAGMKPGDLIVEIDGKPAASGAMWTAAQGELSITWLNAAHEAVTAKVPGGPMGVQTKSIWPGAAAFYWQEGKKDPKWDDDCLVAAWCFYTDPELAETCLAHAKKAGLRDDYFTDLLAAQIAYVTLRFDVALQFAYFAWKQDRPKSMDTLNQLLPDLAAQTGFLGIGEEIYKTAGDKIPAAWHKDFDWNTEHWKNNAAQQAVTLPLANLIARKPRFNLLTHATYTKETAAKLFVQLRHKGNFTLDGAGGRWRFAVLNTPAPNIDLSYTMNIPALDSADTEGGQRGHMISGLVDPTVADMNNFWTMPMISREGWLSYTLWPGYIWMQAGNQLYSNDLYIPNVIYRNYFHGKLKWRIISYQHWTEIWLNDEVAFRAPSAAPCKQLCAFWRLRNGKMEISDVKFEEILETPKADTPMPADPEVPKDDDF